MNEAYLVLSDEERAKGFVRPVRKAYQHVGVDCSCGLATRQQEWRDLRLGEFPAAADPRNAYPTGHLPGCAYRRGCGTVTTMADAIAETYAREPSFYGATYCCGCRTHLPVGLLGEFVWDGTVERVGT